MDNTPHSYSRLALGCQRFGYDAPSTGDAISMEESLRMLDAYAKAGGTLLDTARSYHIYDGRPPLSERCIGLWLRKKHEELGDDAYPQWRNRLTIISKGCYPQLPERTPRLTVVAIRDDMEASLDALGTHIDLWLFHRDDPTRTVEDIVDSLATALTIINIKQPLIRATGASNWTAERIHQANDYARMRYGIPMFVASEVEWSLALASRPFAEDMVRMDLDRSKTLYAMSDMPVLAYTSQAKGLLCSDEPISSGNDRERFLSPKEIRKANLALKELVQDIAKRKGIFPAAVSLLWLIQREPPVTIPVLGCKNSGELGQVLPLLSQDIRLSHEELNSLDQIRIAAMAYLHPNV